MKDVDMLVPVGTSITTSTGKLTPPTMIPRKIDTGFRGLLREDGRCMGIT